MNLILASQSPRRRELLQQAGYEFTVFHLKVSEIFDESLNAREVPRHLAEVKARACLDQLKSSDSLNNLILGSDTVVVLGDQILGKPRDNSQARRYLRALSGATHHVMTGLALIDQSQSPPKVWSDVTVTEVTFRELGDDEIADYVATGEPMDKAGAYAIQGGARKFVSSYKGSWSNVVGLPLETLELAFNTNGWTVGRLAPSPD